ncbi:MAG: peptidoglycan-binding protein [Candidatus Omnitrophica bacterium]|nr:peptidoglycan-binding protein [Candidatus Omnitrophota bacterium]
MKKGFWAIFLSTFLIVGCARLSKKDLEIQNLKNQISNLEIQLKEKEQEIQQLRSALDQERYTPSRKIVLYETKQRPTIKQIQIALKNAGFDPGPIDGKMGTKTRQAIKSFQKANGLNPDGKVGKRTWMVLKKYLK